MSKQDGILRVGVVGLGWQGGSHLQNAAAEPRVRLTAICDINEKLLAERGEAFGVSRRFTDFRELAACDEVDAVSVVLPDFLHHDAALAVLEAGKHLLLEKPMAITVPDAEAIAAAAARAPGVCMVNLSNRWMPVFSSGKGLLDSGKLGPIRYIFSRMTNRIEVPTERLKWLQQSHPAHWIGVHRLDIARWFVGRDVVRVRAVHRDGLLKERGFNTVDFYQATLEFDGGAVMSLEGSWILPPGYPGVVDSRFYCLCNSGVIDIDRMRSEMSVAGPERFDMSTPTTGAFLGRPAGFTMEALRHFVDCCLEGKTPLVTANDGLALTRALCAVVESCEKDGAVIELGPAKPV
ncbi:MAG: Gfo/Idh/MocA family oxidoreductase [Armatimonadetes bacterium]|nr:Gfo/Idh/MocA family oxidoreductase [Armatimonadota bacterium]